MTDPRSLPTPCVIVLVGPGASGKSTWAEQHFPAPAIVSSDALRAVVGSGTDDLAASADAFRLLDQIVAGRLSRRLTTVIDTLGLDAPRRRAYLDAARAHGLHCVAVVFDTPAAACRERNRARERRLPQRVLDAQLRIWPDVRDALAREGFDQVLTPEPVRTVAPAFASAPAAVRRQRDQPVGVRFGLQLARFPDRDLAGWLREVAPAAEWAGFDAVYVMDHFRQIPQVGRAWEPMPESYTTLAWLAALTTRVRLGTLVTGVTYRNVAHLAKITATLDVLSEGRAVCGVGLGWFAEEHQAYGWRFPPVRERYRLLEDALRLLPLMWGPGSAAFAGDVLEVPDTSCYPRPVQSRVPVLLGGGGERRTLRLAAQYADAANVFGDAGDVRHKTAVLHAHCRDAGRDPSAVEMTHLSTVLVGADDTELRALVESHRPRGRSAETYAATVNAGVVGDHVGRVRELAEAGAAEVVVRLADVDRLDGSDAAERVRLFGDVIAAFR